MLCAIKKVKAVRKKITLYNVNAIQRNFVQVGKRRIKIFAFINAFAVANKYF